MDKDQVKGAMDDAMGRAKRQVGEWTGDSKTQAEGAAQQVKGKAEKAWGGVKDAVHNASTDADRERERRIETERNRESEHVGSGPNQGRR
jgi:uncharacterized protein YjbJ (UPF0337 family)